MQREKLFLAQQGYRLLEHTADMGIEATAPTCEQLFVEAARGLLDILGGHIDRQRGDEQRTICAEGIDRADLLVRWLEEIRYVIESEHFYPTSFEVKKAGEHQITARVRGAPYDTDRNPLDREVKAITYHGLSVERDRDGGWRAQVFVDL